MKTLAQFASDFLLTKKSHLHPTVTYEVLPVNCKLWEGGFVDEKGNVREVENHHGKWRYSFEDVNHLKVYDLVAYPESIETMGDTIMNIYVDGKVVASGKSSRCVHIRYLEEEVQG